MRCRAFSGCSPDVVRCSAGPGLDDENPIGSMVLLYMVTWIPSIYPLYVSIFLPAPPMLAYIPAPWIRHGTLAIFGVKLSILWRYFKIFYITRKHGDSTEFYQQITGRLPTAVDTSDHCSVQAACALLLGDMYALLQDKDHPAH